MVQLSWGLEFLSESLLDISSILLVTWVISQSFLQILSLRYLENYWLIFWVSISPITMTSKIIHNNCQIFKLELLFILSSLSVHQWKTCSSSMTISYNHTTLKLFINKGLDNCYLLAILLLMYEFVYEKKSKKIYKMENLNFFKVIKLYWVPFSMCPILLPYNSIKIMVYVEKRQIIQPLSPD